MICWPLTSLLLLFLLFLWLQSLQLRGSGSSWAKKTMPRRLLNSSRSWTSCWPWTARRWSGRKRPGERQNKQKNRIFIMKNLLLQPFMNMSVCVLGSGMFSSQLPVGPYPIPIWSTCSVGAGNRRNSHMAQSRASAPLPEQILIELFNCSTCQCLECRPLHPCCLED